MNLFVLVLSIYISFITKGSSSIQEAWLKIAENSQLILSAMPIYLVYCGIRAFFKVNSELKKLGAWQGKRFVYHQPHHVFTYHILPRDNNKVIEVIFKHAEPNCIVQYKIEYDGGISKVLLDSEKMPWFWDKISTYNQSGAIKIGKKRETKMTINCSDQSNQQTSVRIYMIFWEIE